MSDSVIYKGAPPPPPSAKVRAQRRRQRKLILLTLAGILTAVGTWRTIAYINDAEPRAIAEVTAGRTFLTPGHYAEAVPHFDRAIEIFPNLPDAYYQRAVAHVNLGQTEAAAADFRSALDLKPDLVEASAGLAEIYRQAGDQERAIKELTRTISLKPTVDAYYQRGTAYAELGRHEEAIADYTWVIDKTRDAPFIYFARAKSRRALGDLEGARQDEATALTFERGRELEPGN